MIVRLTAALAAAGTLGACATAPASDPFEALDAEAEAALARYERTGETRNCVSTRRIDRIEPLSERVWLFEMRGGEDYLNVVSRGCSGADSAFTYLQYETSGTQLCASQIVRVIDQPSDSPRGSCGLGPFERLDRLED